MLGRTALRVLDEMERVSKQDLSQFLQTHNVAVPLSHWDRVLDEILATTQGDYDLTLEALKDLVARKWAMVSDSERAGQAEVEDWDYE